jgi:hypothetical protein
VLSTQTFEIHPSKSQRQRCHRLFSGVPGGGGPSQLIDLV